MSNNNEELTVEFQYNFFLKRMGLVEDKMSEIQKNEIKNAFIGGFGQALLVMIQGVAMLPEDEIEKAVTKLFQEVSEFWKQQLITKH